MPSQAKQVRFDSCVFEVCGEVYEPAEDSFLFAQNLKVKASERVLDVGTGSGILAVLAAKKAEFVVALDVNPFAVSCAQKNAQLNHVQKKIQFLQSDLFSALSPNSVFDLILFNAPYLPSEPREEASWIGRSWAGGANGRVVVDKFIAQAPSYLASSGRVLLMQSTLTGVEETVRKFQMQNLAAKVVAEQRLPFFETLTLIEAKRNL
jgi:release factor glutamine methyltransferase